MITAEELAIFKSELTKLTNESRRCVDQSLKLKIQADVTWLKMAIVAEDPCTQTIENE